MKKITAIICCVLLLFLTTLTGYADASAPNRIYAEKIYAVAGEAISIPIKISGNTGFMGFAINIDYDPAVLTPVSVSRADLLIGMFDDSIETSEPGRFRVVFTGTGNIASDGQLFTVVFNASENASGNTQLSLSYSKGDTFDENYHDIVFNCENTTVTFGSNTYDPGKDDLMLSARIKDWAAGLKTPWKTIMTDILAPIVFILSLFGR